MQYAFLNPGLHLALLGVISAIVSLPQPASAQVPAAPPTGQETRAFSVPAGPLDAALERFARAAGIAVSYDPASVRGVTTRGLAGTFSVPAALAEMLAGSNLEAVARPGGGYAVRGLGAGGSPPPPTALVLPEVLVTASTERQGELAEPFAGGQVARGGRVGVLGERDVFETPFNVTNFTQQTIEDRQAVFLADVVRGDPSVRVASPTSTFYTDLLIRGFRVTGSATTYDGLSATFGDYAPNLLQAIERVEIIKGANTLLGGVTTGLTAGGSINLVPKRATDAPVTDVAVNVTSDSQVGGHLDIGRRFGSDNAFGARLNVFGQDGNTAYDNEHQKLSLLALALDYRGERARAFLDVGRSQQNTRGALASLYLDPGLGIAVPPVPRAGSNFSQPFTFSDVTSRYLLLRGEVDVLPDVTAYAAFGGQNTDSKQLLSFGLLTGPGGDIDEIFQNGTDDGYTRTWELCLRARFTTGPVQHRAVLSVVRSRFGNTGTYIFDAESGGQPTVPSNIYHPVRVAPRPDISFPGLSDPSASNRNLLPSVALVDTLSMLDERLLLTLGLRQQRIAYGNGDSYTSGYDESALTPTVAALYRITPAWAVYGNYIESMQGGPSAPATAVNANEVFPPSKNRQYELGLKADFGAFGMTADVFSIEQPSGLVDPATNIFALIGKQVNRGVELFVFGEPAKGFRLTGGIAYIDAKYNRTENGLYDGKTAPGVPNTNLSLLAEYDLPFAPGLTVLADVLSTSSAWLDAANTTKLPGYTDVQLGLRYATDIMGQRTTFRANVSNVFNSTHWVADVYGSFYLGQPRSVTLSASAAF